MLLINVSSKTRRHGDREKYPRVAVSPCRRVPIPVSPCPRVPVPASPRHFPNFFLSSSTNTRRRNLPTWVFGSSERNSTYFGTL